MILSLGLLLFSFLLTGILSIPFIHMLYRLKFQRQKQITKDMFGRLTPIFDKFHKHKAGTPVGGGLLIILVVSVLFSIIFPVLSYLGYRVTSVYPLLPALNVIFFSFLSFGALGLYDDIKKFFGFEKTGFFGLSVRHKLAIQVILAGVAAIMMYAGLSISFINVPFFGVINLGWWFIPFAMFTIVAFANAVNVTDGLDGLATGLLMICLFGLWIISASVLDTPISLFLAIWIGALIAFMYFNIYPARIWLGDVGALSFGATLAVIGLLLGKVMALVVIGGIFVVEVGSSAIQLWSKRTLKKKIFPAAPLHLWLQHYGWEEPKIVQRAIMTGLVLMLFGVWLTFV